MTLSIYPNQPAEHFEIDEALNDLLIVYSPMLKLLTCLVTLLYTYQY